MDKITITITPTGAAFYESAPRADDPDHEEFVPAVEVVRMLQDIAGRLPDLPAKDWNSLTARDCNGNTVLRITTE